MDQNYIFNLIKFERERQDKIHKNRLKIITGSHINDDGVI